MNEKKEKPVVFVDYLQILSSCTGNRNATERQKNDENINELSGLSNKYDLAVCDQFPEQRVLPGGTAISEKWIPLRRQEESSTLKA